MSLRGRDYHSDIPATALQEFLDYVRLAKISVLGDCPMGLNGMSYELTLQEGTAYATYRWCETPDARWLPLKKSALTLLNLGF